MWARLRAPVVSASPRLAVTVNGQNIGRRFIYPDGPDRVVAITTFYFGPPYSTPGFRGYFTDIPWVSAGDYKYADPPFSFSVRPGSAIGAGSWKPGLWTFRVRVEFVDRNNAPYASIIFYVLDGFECTGTGSVSVSTTHG